MNLFKKKKINKVILVMLYKHFEKKDYVVFDVDVIKNHGYNVEIWDFCNLRYNFPIELPINSRECLEIKYFNFLNEVDRYFETNSVKECFFIIYPGEGNEFISNYVRKKIICKGSKYANYYYPLTIHTRIPKTVYNNFFTIARKYILDWKDDPYRAYTDINSIKNSIIYPSSYEFLQGKACIERVNNKFIRTSKKCKILHSFDYDAFIREKDKENIVQNKYAVFIDEYNTGHSDFKKMGIHPPIEDEKKYFNELNSLFKIIEEKYSLEVVIALHPKAEYRDNPFEGRKMLLYQTQRLIKNCELCILHTSTCFQYILYCKKPYLQVLTSELIKNEAYYSEMMQYEKLGYSIIANADEISKENIDYYINNYNENKHKKFVEYYLNPYENSDKLNMTMICDFINKIR